MGNGAEFYLSGLSRIPLVMAFVNPVYSGRLVPSALIGGGVDSPLTLAGGARLHQLSAERPGLLNHVDVADNAAKNQSFQFESTVAHGVHLGWAIHTLCSVAAECFEITRIH